MMAIHLAARLLAPLSVRTVKPYSLVASFVSRRYLQEFPDLKLNNVLPQDYILVLPEPLNETPQSNESLKLPKIGEPEIDFLKLNTYSLYKSVSQTICSFDDFLTDIDEGNVSLPESFGEFLKMIEEKLYPMDSANNILTVLTNVDPKSYNYKEIADLIKKYSEIREKRFSGKIRTQLQNYIRQNENDLSDVERRLLEIYHGKSLKRTSLATGDEKILSLCRKNLREDRMAFFYNLVGANQLFSHTVDDPDILTVVTPEFDDCQDLHHKERTPLKITASTFNKFMRVCPDRFVRKNLWQVLNKRCSPKAFPKYNNLSNILSIRASRRKIADLSGYRSYVEMKLENALAESKTEILDNLSTLNVENSRILNDRLQELNDYAADNEFEDPSQLGIQEFDVDFWTHKYKYDILIGKSEAELKSYFPLPTVMKGLQTYFENYFGIEMKSTPENLKGKLWDQSVLSFEVSRNNQPVGGIIFDPYNRPDKRQNLIYARLRGRSSIFQCLPTRLISASYKIDQSSEQPLLTITDMMNLFYCYATVIQRLLYNYEHYELNNSGGFENEVINLLPNLCIAHLLSDHRILQSCSDRGSSKSIDTELASKILKALTYFQSFNTWRQLYQSHLDLEVHSNQTDVRTLVKEIYPIYSPFTRDSDDYDFCAMDNIFVGPNDGTHYTDLWAKQLANFCLSESLPAGGDMSSIDTKKILDFDRKLLDALFDPEKLKIQPKLQSLVGRNFKRSKPSLGVL